jgi:hypothetical protein
MVDAEISWAVTELLSRYGHVVDARAWPELTSVFTGDATLHTEDGSARGLAEIQAYLEAVDARRSHHTLNPVLKVDGATVRAWSRFILIEADATSLGGDYIDELTNTPAGWRISARRITRRNRPGAAPGGDPWRIETFASWEAR